MNKKTVCLYHILRNEDAAVCVRDDEGTGDCSLCTPHQDNQQCKSYRPVMLEEFEIKKLSELYREDTWFNYECYGMSCEDV